MNSYVIGCAHSWSTSGCACSDCLDSYCGADLKVSICQWRCKSDSYCFVTSIGVKPTIGPVTSESNAEATCLLVHLLAYSAVSSPACLLGYPEAKRIANYTHEGYTRG